jgi:small subunit ribosomal protein S1
VTASEPTESLSTFLHSVQPGEIRTARVAGFTSREVIVDLDGADGPHHCAGRIPRHELSRKPVEDPAAVVSIGQSVEAEVIAVDWRSEQVFLSARACEDPVLRAFLLGLHRGEVATGTVTGVHNFGVFVSLDGEPAGSETGFIRVPELSWSRIDRPADVVEVGRRVAGEVLDADTRRGQVAISVKALQEDPAHSLRRPGG